MFYSDCDLGNIFQHSNNEIRTQFFRGVVGIVRRRMILRMILFLFFSPMLCRSCFGMKWSSDVDCAGSFVERVSISRANEKLPTGRA